MNPNDNQQIPPDETYLDQIAPKAPSRIDFLRNKLVIIGGIGILVVIVAMIVAGIMAGSIKPQEQLAARLLSTKSILDDATPKSKNTQLRTSNGNLKIYLTNTIRDFTPLLDKENININKLSKNATSAESNTTVLATLEDARLNAIYDRTYAREMSYKLDTVLALMRQISESSGNKNLKTFLQDAYKNLEPIQAQFADFNAANS